MVVVVVKRVLLGRESIESNDLASNNVEEKGGANASSLMGSCSDFKMSEV
jgi:hypothetical protein